MPAGRVVIRNNGAAPVQKLKVSFAIQGYMDYPSETSIAELHSMEQKEVPFFATFNNRILEVTETTPIQAQVKLTYYTGDQATSFRAEPAVQTVFPQHDPLGQQRALRVLRHAERHARD